MLGYLHFRFCGNLRLRALMQFRSSEQASTVVTVLKRLNNDVTTAWGLFYRHSMVCRSTNPSFSLCLRLNAIP